MVGAIAAGGGGFGGVAAYCLEEKLQQQEQQKQEEARQEREQEAREWMPDQGGAPEEKRERDETEILSGRGRDQAQHSPDWSRAPARRDEEEEKKRAAERERERKAGGARRLAARVEWAETRNLATNDPWRAARIMGATAADGPELKRLAGGKATGRKLAKPVCHYTLNWAPEERPDRQEMSRAVTGSLQALGAVSGIPMVVPDPPFRSRAANTGKRSSRAIGRGTNAASNFSRNAGGERWLFGSARWSESARFRSTKPSSVSGPGLWETMDSARFPIIRRVVDCSENRAWSPAAEGCLEFQTFGFPKR